MVHKSTLNENGGGGGVSSVNSLTGSLTLTSTGGTISITPSGTNIDLEAVGGGASVTPVSSFPYTAIAAAGLTVYTLYNSSGSAVTFKLPAAPVTNEIAIIVDAGLNSGTYLQTINGNGNNIIAYGTGTNSTIGINANGGSVALAWDGINFVQYA